MNKRKKTERYPHVVRLLQPSGVLGQSRLVSPPHPSSGPNVWLLQVAGYRGGWGAVCGCWGRGVWFPSPPTHLTLPHSLNIIRDEPHTYIFLYNQFLYIVNSRILATSRIFTEPELCYFQLLECFYGFEDPRPGPDHNVVRCMKSYIGPPCGPKHAVFFFNIISTNSPQIKIIHRSHLYLRTTQIFYRHFLNVFNGLLNNKINNFWQILENRSRWSGPCRGSSFI